MSDLDPDIANGTCYYAYNEAAGDELVPCGNGGIDHVPCCFGGDYCDAESTCYDRSSESIFASQTSPGNKNVLTSSLSRQHLPSGLHRLAVHGRLVSLEV